MEIVSSRLLKEFPELIQGFSTREWGNMSFRYPGADSVLLTHITENNLAFMRALGCPDQIRFFDPILKHSNTVALVDRNPNAFREEIWYHPSTSFLMAKGSQVIPEKDEPALGCLGVDALWTTARGTVLTMRPADCAIVYLYDPRTRSIGMVHAGTAGVLCGIVPFSIEAGRRWLGLRPADLYCFIGPSISGANYDLTKTSAWRDGLDHVMPEPIALKYDPKRRLFGQLVAIGVKEERIEVHPDCTFAQGDKYFSHHRHGSRERMLAVFGLR